MFLSEICQVAGTFLSQQAIVNADIICISNLNNVAQITLAMTTLKVVPTYHKKPHQHFAP